jgi:hypothetical protein
LKSFCSDIVALSRRCEDLQLLKDLCGLVPSVLFAKDGSIHLFGWVNHFLSLFATTYGQIVEDGAIASLSGSPLIGRGHELGPVLTDLVLRVVSWEDSFGVLPDASRGQRHGQPSFETGSRETRATDTTSNEYLVSLLNLLTVCIGHCPVFTLHLPARKGVPIDEERLLHRYVNFAADSLGGEDQDLLRSSIMFLLEMVSDNEFISCSYFRVNSSNNFADKPVASPSTVQRVCFRHSL